ncbi:MAG TPA: hypothetical protein ENH25_00950 [candidate division Zixibacteria bacterium]|nr:hypothetical protein [candidate division Zixibacteria bacterium]
MPDNNKKTIIFSDFDGSFSEKDIGHRIFRYFSNGEILPLVEQWKRGEISSRECLRREAAMIHPTYDEIYEFLLDFRLADGAVEFYRTIKSLGIPFYIVSDGTDIYIDYILRKYDLGEIKYFCNIGKIENRTLSLDFIYDNDGCQRCGCCKGARINDLVGSSRSEWEIIFIGDGLSDICAVPHADIIYARGDLLEYCREHAINAKEYNDFNDILTDLKKSGHVTG